MEEQFILRVPPSVAEQIEKLLNENSSSSSEDDSLDLSFSEDGRSGSFAIGNKHFPVSLMDLPCILESYKTYDDQTLIKTADIGQMVLVREESDLAPEGVEYRHGITPPMRDVRRRRFRREPDLNPELVQRVEKDLLMARATAESTAPMGDGQRSKATAKPTLKANPAPEESAMNGDEPERSDSEDTDDSMEPEN